VSRGGENCCSCRKTNLTHRRTETKVRLDLTGYMDWLFPLKSFIFLIAYGGAFTVCFDLCRKTKGLCDWSGGIVFCKTTFGISIKQRFIIFLTILPKNLSHEQTSFIKNRIYSLGLTDLAWLDLLRRFFFPKRRLGQRLKIGFRHWPIGLDGNGCYRVLLRGDIRREEMALWICVKVGLNCREEGLFSGMGGR